MLLGLIDRLGMILDWYKRMISDDTGRLVYTYEPERDLVVADGSPIRDIASIWDIEVLSRFLGRPDLLPVIERSLQHYTSFLVGHGGGLILDPVRIGEPSGIAHSAFLILALLPSSLPGRDAMVAGLVAAILGQQRTDGSYRIYFAGEPDDGLELYPAEAMLALLEAYETLHEPRYLNSAERAFRFQHDRRPADTIAPDYLVFYANWQAQYGTLLHKHTHARVVRDHVFALHDRIVRSGFYDRVERTPARQATVEVACGLEGLADAYALAVREHDEPRIDAYARCVRIALAFLSRAQRLVDCTPRELGGFGHKLDDRTQRIDVTGHVATGFIKSLQNRIDLQLS